MAIADVDKMSAAADVQNAPDVLLPSGFSNRSHSETRDFVSVVPALPCHFFFYRRIEYPVSRIGMLADSNQLQMKRAKITTNTNPVEQITVCFSHKVPKSRAIAGKYS